VHPAAETNLRNAVEILGCSRETVYDRDAIKLFRVSLEQYMDRPIPGMLSALVCFGCRRGITAVLIDRGYRACGITTFIHASSYLEGAPHKEALRKAAGIADGEAGLRDVLRQSPGYPFAAKVAWGDILCGSSFISATLRREFPRGKYLGYFDYVPTDPSKQRDTIRSFLAWREPRDGFHFDCHITPFKKILSFALYGYTEHEFYLSEMIRMGLLSRTAALTELYTERRAIAASREAILTLMKQLHFADGCIDKMVKFWEESEYLPSPPPS